MVCIAICTNAFLADGGAALSLVFMAAYIPMVFPAGWVLDGLPRQYGVPFGGLRWGMLLAAVGSAVGACIRVIPPYCTHPKHGLSCEEEVLTMGKGAVSLGRL